ncbi:TonB-dependent receptor [Shewanella yunxiaonensis]|uniref:TonB-dependent receptor n=1 Tax=Shewanella yunxiaonensis TaxID=2829809 RepID=A0ABX7YSG8_9GAMM|nr:TonB-dependent receptor [Shewanella yunxiaonensis]QUN05066.1 TonB-dependent receptor [Shewanella yunxiaonensis]
MITEKLLSRSIRSALPYALMLSCASVAFTAQVRADDEDDTTETAAAAAGTANIEKMVVTGSRGAARSVKDSPVPVDVIADDELKSVSFSDTNDVLKTLVPSYSVDRQPISDGGTFVRPATLRGMDTDKTLVLVNGHRRHRSALVQIGGSGTQGPDISTIPTSALKTVEVLRDGAAAQYGSDAIAGVINFQLKDNSEGGSFSADWGQYYKGDGDTLTLTANKGFALGDKGFLSISADYVDSDPTTRAQQYCESYFCVTDPSTFPAGYGDYATYVAGLGSASLNSDGNSVVQSWGNPKTKSKTVFFNSGYTVSEALDLYAFGNYTDKSGSGNFFYRYPRNGTIMNIRLEDGSTWNALSMYPGGFTPLFSGDITDKSLVAGAKGMLSSGLGYDLSGRYGSNEIDYTLSNTINPSMGDQSPTTFHPGNLINTEAQLQGDFTQDFDVSSFSSPLLFAFGFSYMKESYELQGGDEASYEAGTYSVADPWGFCNDDGTATDAGLAVIANGSSLNCANSSDPVYQIMGVGSNGFPGYSPAYSGKYNRHSYAGYIDLSADVTDKLFLQTAFRYEDYSDFGSKLVGKIAGNYRITDKFGVRASYGTGFRAPTPGQQGTTNVSTRITAGMPVATGLFPAGGAVAQALGASKLKPETSTNYTLGLTADFDSGVGMTLDFYRIDLKDRMYSISTMNVSSDPTSAAYDNYLALVDAGVSGAESIGGVFYFQNMFDTRTTGMDFVTNYGFDNALGYTSLTLSANYNKQEITQDKTGAFNAEDTFDFENGAPKWRGVFTVNHTIDDFTFTARANYYGSYKNSDGEDTITDTQKFGQEMLVDLEVSYQLTETMKITVGGRNILDNYPDKGQFEVGQGRIYRDDSVVDWNGGYYFTRFSMDF